VSIALETKYAGIQTLPHTTAHYRTPPHTTVHYLILLGATDAAQSTAQKHYCTHDSFWDREGDGCPDFFEVCPALPRLFPRRLPRLLARASASAADRRTGAGVTRSVTKMATVALTTTTCAPLPLPPPPHPCSYSRSLSTRETASTVLSGSEISNCFGILANSLFPPSSFVSLFSLVSISTVLLLLTPPRTASRSSTISMTDSGFIVRTNGGELGQFICSGTGCVGTQKFGDCNFE